MRQPDSLMIRLAVAGHTPKTSATSERLSSWSSENSFVDISFSFLFR